MLTFMEFLASQPFFNEDLKLSDEDLKLSDEDSLIESNKDTKNNYYLPIKEGRLTPEQSNLVRRTILDYLKRFKDEVKNLDIEDTKVQDNDEICKLYIDLSFGVTSRNQNLRLCSYDGKTMFKPKDMKKIIVDPLINKLNQEGLIFRGSKECRNKEFSISYTIETRLYIPSYDETIDVYLKFDFRINQEGWQESDYNNRYSKWKELNRKNITVPKENSKLCAISLHQERSVQ